MISNQGKLLKVVFVDPQEYHQLNMRASTTEAQVADFMAYKEHKEQKMLHKNSVVKIAKQNRQTCD